MIPPLKRCCILARESISVAVVGVPTGVYSVLFGEVNSAFNGFFAWGFLLAARGPRAVSRGAPWANLGNRSHNNSLKRNEQKKPFDDAI